MASTLGLSVHTVNERLREVLRKLSVSSSKAAARIVYEAETVTPQSVVDKTVGDVDAAPHGQTFDPRRTGWVLPAGPPGPSEDLP